METFETIELIELVPENVIENYNLTKKQTMLLGLFIVYNNLDQSKNNGFFYRSNKDICKDIDISEPTLITALTKLETMELIERKTGNRTDGASEYKLNKDLIFNTKINTKILSNNLSKNFSDNLSNNFSEILDIIRDYQHTMNMVIELLLKSNTKNLSNNLSNNFSTDTETDIDKEIDKIKNNINKNNNIIKENNINKNIIKKEKQIIINNNLEKEKEDKAVESKVDGFTFNINKKDVEGDETKIETLSSNSIENIEAIDEENKTMFQENNKIEETPSFEKIDDTNTIENLFEKETFEDDEYDDTKKLSSIEASELLLNFYDTNKNDVTNETDYKEFETVLNLKLNNLVTNEQITNEQYQSIKTFVTNLLLNNLRIKIYTSNTYWDKKPSLSHFIDTNLSSTQDNEETPSEALKLANAPIVEETTHTADTNEENTEALEKEFGAEFIDPFASLEKASRNPQNNDGVSSTHTTQENRSEALKTTKNDNTDNADESKALMKKLVTRAKTLFNEATTHQECRDINDKVTSGIEKLMDEGKLTQSDYSNLKNKVWFAYTEKRSALLQSKN